MTNKQILRLITDESNKLVEKFLKENDIHEAYYSWGVRRLEKQLKKQLLKDK